MHKITLVLLGGLLVFWSAGVGAQMMLDAKPEAKGGNPVGTWKADSTALQIYVAPALLNFVDSLSVVGSVSGTLELDEDEMFDADYTISSHARVSATFLGAPIKIDTVFVVKNQHEGAYQLDETSLILEPDVPDTMIVPPDTLGYSVEGDTLRLIQEVPLGTYTATLAMLSIPPPLSVVNMLRVEEDVSAGLTGDFDGNGKVDFDDFVAFATNFGKRSGDAGFDPKYDLNGNGAVDFPDFVDFARQFGTSA